MFIGRRLDGSIYGAWASRQPDDSYHPRQEEVADDDSELLAFLAPPAPDPRIVQDETEETDAKGDGAIIALIDQTRAEWKTWTQANFPSLTTGEQNRLSVLFWIVAIAIRRHLRN